MNFYCKTKSSTNWSPTVLEAKFILSVQRLLNFCSASRQSQRPRAQPISSLTSHYHDIALNPYCKFWNK